MTLQVGVKIFIQDEQTGKYLAIHRSLAKYPDVKDQLWDIPGGRIEPGKPLAQNLQREVTEEVGMVLVGEPRLIAAQDIIRPEKDIHVVRLTYTGRAAGEVVLSDEHDAYEWLTAAEMVERTLSENPNHESITHAAAKLL